ncbi:MAG: signal peptide peptidase SppA [Rubrobacteraceae bacterium]
MDSGNEPRASAENRQDRPEEQPRRRRRRWPWVVGGLAVLALLILGAGAIAAVVALTANSGTAGAAPVVYEEEYVSGEGSNKIAVVPVEGTIASADSTVGGVQSTVTPEGLESALDQAASDESVKGVVLEVNSPGGGVTASDQMHQSILDFKESSGKPVIVSMGDTAASGGYYISTAADEIVANETTLTGSLGVIVTLTNFSEAADKYGIRQEVIKSGEFKDIGSSFRELKPEEREIFQSIVDESYAEFVSVISEGRDLPEERVREIADGRIYSGEQARDLGLVDEFGDLELAAGNARDRAGIGEATVIRYVLPETFSDMLLARLAPQEPEAVQIMEAAGLYPTPQLQYLYRPGL